MKNTIIKDTKDLREPLSMETEHIAHAIVDVAFTIHKALGPGLLESVYEVCFVHELAKRGIAFNR